MQVTNDWTANRERTRLGLQGLSRMEYRRSNAV